MNNKNSNSGFTLIELMIAVAIVGIIAAIAYPAYQDSIRKGNRTDGQSTLLEIQSRQERYAYDNNTYTADLRDLGYDNEDDNPTPEGHYQITASAGACGDIADCYLLTATPQGAQVPDGNLTLSSTGVKGGNW